MKHVLILGANKMKKRKMLTGLLLACANGLSDDKLDEELNEWLQREVE